MDSTSLNRREMFGLAAGLTLLPHLATAQAPPSLELPEKIDYRKPSRPVTCVIIGAGNRGNTYASYAAKAPEQWQVVGVAEPIAYRNQKMAQEYSIPSSQSFETWEQVFDRPKFADVAVITTPDNLHYGPAMEALRLGYDVLVEKVVAQSWRECNDILKLAQEKGSIVGVCHVLRYTPYFRSLKHLVDSGQIGEVVSVQHLEPVEHIHMSHSFVRGNWRNSKESNPILLSKSCHDLDILRWIIGKPCRRVSSFGSLALFRKEMAPEGAPLRCTDGCPAEAKCPYSAIKIYLKGKSRLSHLKIDNHSDQAILGALKNGLYGRCVYHCDNDVVDHQVTNLEFENGVTAAFSMEGLTSYGGRLTRLMGTRGDINGNGNGEFIELNNFITGKRTKYDTTRLAEINSGHGGGDHGLVRDLVQAVSRRDASLLSSTLEASMESHLMGFMAEESRLNNGRVCEVKL